MSQLKVIYHPYQLAPKNRKLAPEIY